MNKELTEGLRRKTAHLPIAIEVIEDDANNILNHLPSGSIDAIVFEHSINDILQAFIGEANGMDTTNGDWFALLPEMIRLTGEAYVCGTLANQVKAPFLSLVQNCLAAVKPGGYLVMSHYMFQYDLDLGYNPELWQEILPVVRPWLAELPGGTEVAAAGFDPQWWLFFQKTTV